MSSLLRSSKFVRYFAGFARNLVFNPSRGEVDVSLIQKSHCLTNGLTKSLSTQTVQSHPQPDSNLDKSLRRLDQDVRRSGRISRRELEDVLEEIRHARSASSTQSLLIIRCCGNLVPEELPEVRTHLVQEIWKTLENLGVPMDVSHYNALLRVYLENEHPFSPTEFLSDLERKGVEPNRVTYQRLIARYCQEGDIEGATRILEYMREKQLPVNESVFNALIMGHSQADDMESAAGILKVMEQAGLEPSSDTYTTLLCGYAKRGDMDAVTRTLEHCDLKDILLLDKDYFDVIFALAVNNHTQHVDKIVDRLRQMAGYNHDAVNLILRLVNCGQEDVAVKILHTMRRASRTDGQSFPVGTFLLKQMVKANRPVEKIVQLCVELEQQNLNPRALSIATETSLQLGNVKQTSALLAAMKKEGHPIRHHYFWPLLTASGKKGDKEGLLEIVENMNTQFGLTPGGETLRDYVIPYLSGSVLNSSTADAVINELRMSGVSVASAACAVVCNLLTSNNLAGAAQVASRYRAYYSTALLRRPLVQAFYQSRDTEAYITMLRQIYEGVDRLADFSTSGEEENTTVPDRAEMVGQLVLDIAYNFRKDTTAVLQQVLEGLLAQGLAISNNAAVRLQDKLSGDLTSDISSLLAKLTGSDLVPLAVSRTGLAAQPSLDERQLKSLIASLEARGESTRGPKKQLLVLFCRNRDLEQAEPLYKELQMDDDFVSTSGMMAQLIELYTHHDKLDEALSYLKQLQSRETNFVLDETKVIKLTLLLVKNDRFQDALELLGGQSRERRQEERSFAYSSLCWRLLNTIAEQGQVENVQAMFNALIEHQFVDVSNVILGPLIKVHIVKNDLSGAMEQFEQCCLKYRSTPWKSELTCKLIQAEDAASLQKLTDLSTQVHGEVNSLYDLVFAFVECGRIRQARKILETPGLRSRPLRLNSACARYRQEGMVAHLEGLVEATRDLSHIDRCEIYHHLLLSYCKAEDADKALGLWTRMQEEDVQPTDEFLSVLGNFLKAQRREVPFIIPEVPLAVSSVQPKEAPATSTTAVSTDVALLRQSLRQENYDQALEIKTRLDKKAKDQLTVTDLSLLVEGLVKTSRLGEASKLTLTLLEANIFPLPRIFRFFLNRVASAGDVDTLTALGKHLEPEKKKLLSYDNRLCHANVTAGRGSQYLDVLEKEIDNVKTEELAVLAEKFPRGGAIGILEKQPELHSQYERIACKYADHGITAPINVLWMHLFETGQEEAANKLWDKYLTKCSRLMFQHVIQLARENADPDLAHKLVTKLKTSSVSEGPRGIAHSCLLDVLVSTGKIDETETALDDAVKDVCLENINRTALLRIQTQFSSQGKIFKYRIPEKNAKSSSSSSDDDEKPPSRKQ